MTYLIISWVASILLASSLIPQIIKMWKTKSARDVSLFTILCFVFGNGSWCIYAYLQIFLYDQNTLIQLAFTNTLLFSFGVILMILKSISILKNKVPKNQLKEEEL